MQRTKMTINERAKIFAPFDALKGFRELLKEQEFIKEDKKILLKLNTVFSYISSFGIPDNKLLLHLYLTIYLL